MILRYASYSPFAGTYMADIYNFVFQNICIFHAHELVQGRSNQAACCVAMAAAWGAAHDWVNATSS